jgi:roadblock/LC7 domain-containing protein
MIKRLLAVDGVQVVAKFRDDGQLVEGYGMLDEKGLEMLVSFAHDYKRITQANADQLSMFTQVFGWTPPSGWIVRGDKMSVCSMANLVCLIDDSEASLNEVLNELKDLSHY